MSLHNATELIKKIGLFAGIGIGVVIMLTLIFRIGGIIASIVSPPKIIPPNEAYGSLPAIQFPQSEVNNNFTYTLNTISGTLPTDFPDRLVVCPLIQPSPNLLDLDKAKTKVQAIGLVGQQGATLPEVSLGNGNYLWTEPTGLNRKLKLNIVTFDFSLTSNYLASLTVLGAQNLNDENNAIQTTREFLTNMQLLPTDIDFDKTQNPPTNVTYNTYPRLFDIRNGSLVPTTSLSSAKVIRVDLYQKDIAYDLDAGRSGVAKAKLSLPILYPNPPFSTMSFWVASGQSTAEIDAAEFAHRDIDTSSNPAATYPIKTATEAFNDLKNGKAYIASYLGLDKQVLINNIYLAYYMDTNEKYLMPIIVFEGQKNFIAYVPALKESSTQ